MSRLNWNQFVGAQSFANGGTGLVLAVDVTAMAGLPVANGCALPVRCTLVGLSTANEYGRIDLVGDLKRIAGTLTLLNSPTPPYQFFEGAMSPAIAAIAASGNNIQVNLTTGAAAANWTAYLWVGSSTF